MKGPLGIMFHHFHGGIHPPGQGSLSRQDFAHMLEHLMGTHTLLAARDFMTLAEQDGLGPEHACLTFDDSLRCQYDLALPVLEDQGLTAFWFVYTSPLAGQTERLEVYRYFRNSCFADIEGFYGAFFHLATETLGARMAGRLESFSAPDYLPDYPFYSTSDRTFRYLRDEVLDPVEYDALMDRLIANSGQDLSAITKALWMSPEQIRGLHDAGHVVGLHSHSHPMNMERLPDDEQRREYITNHRILTDILGEPPTVMSHPCNRYTAKTLEILSGLGIRLGFRADTALAAPSPLEYPREDHANIFRSMNP